MCKSCSDLSFNLNNLKSCVKCHALTKTNISVLCQSCSKTNMKCECCGRNLNTPDYLKIGKCTGCNR